MDVLEPGAAHEVFRVGHRVLHDQQAPVLLGDLIVQDLVL
jgi:hypothetical protein